MFRTLGFVLLPVLDVDVLLADSAELDRVRKLPVLYVLNQHNDVGTLATGELTSSRAAWLSIAFPHRRHFGCG